ncbi:hypothetical protein J3F84DRAFT_345711 [Trichoderma pleuroticola]
MWRDAGAIAHSLDYLSAGFLDNVVVCQRGYTILDDEEADLAKRGDINVCGRDLNDLIDVPGLAEIGFELIQSTTGSG